MAGKLGARSRARQPRGARPRNRSASKSEKRRRGRRHSTRPPTRRHSGAHHHPPDVPATPAPPSLDDLATALRHLADRVSDLDATQAQSRFPSPRFGRGLQAIRDELARLGAALEAVRDGRAGGS